MSEQRTIGHHVYPPTPHIDSARFFSQPGFSQGKLFSHRMLSFPLRDYVIKNIKDPLRRSLTAGSSFYCLVKVFITILVTAWKIRKHVGKVTKENSVFRNVHVFLDLAELVKECHHNQSRELMLNSANEIAIAIVEHDPYWRYIFYRMVTYLIRQAEVGRWVLADEPPPKALKPCWDEEKFEGGISDGFSSRC